MTKMHGPKKIFILGSCVSRDAMSFDTEQNFTLAGYYARSSLGSSVARPAVSDPYSARVPSAFQRRQINNDFRKSLLNDLLHTDFDLLLLDFIDDRFPLFSFNAGGIVTISIELHQLGVLHASEGTIIPAFSPQHLAYWLIGWKRFMGHARKHGYLHKIRLNKVYWVPPPASDNAVPQDLIDRANAHLETLYTIAAEVLTPDQFLTYDPAELQSTDDHKWGPAAFHYVDALYHATLRQLNSGSEAGRVAPEKSAPVKIAAGKSV